jgi:hypothetical protein
MNTTWWKRIGVLAIVLCGCVSNVGAAIPSGRVGFGFGVERGIPLWNFSGIYSSRSSFYPEDQLELRQDAKGRLSATFVTARSDPAELRGTLKVSGGQAKIQLTSRGPVMEVYYNNDTGAPYTMERRDKLTLSFDPFEWTLFGTDRETRVSTEFVFWTPPTDWSGGHEVKVRPKFVLPRDVEFAVPDTMDGKWALAMELVPTGNRLSGIALVRFSSGDLVRFKLQGTYLPKTDTAKIVLKGDGPDKGATLMLSLSGQDPKILSLRGSVGGQRIQYPQTAAR